MSLPSKHSRQGLSLADQQRTITSGKTRQKSSLTHRVVETKEETLEEADFRDPKKLPPTLRGLGEDQALVNRNQNSNGSTLQVGTGLQARLSKVAGNVSFLVIDTNFILSHLLLLDALKDYGTYYKFILIIPLEVVRELDGLKDSRRSPLNERSKTTVGKLARMANDWIYYCLAEQFVTVYAQGKQEIIDDFLSNDDAILDCSLYFKCVFPQTLHVVLSDDKNLCAKALLNDILTISYRDEMDAQMIAKRVFSENAARFRPRKVKVPTSAVQKEVISRPMVQRRPLSQPVLQKQTIAQPVLQRQTIAQPALQKQTIAQPVVQKKPVSQPSFPRELTQSSQLNSGRAKSVIDSSKSSRLGKEPTKNLMIVAKPLPSTDQTSSHHDPTLERIKIINSVYSEVENILISLAKFHIQSGANVSNTNVEDITSLHDAAYAFDGLTFRKSGTRVRFRFHVHEFHDYCVNVPKNIQELDYFVKFWSKNLQWLYLWSTPKQNQNALNFMIERWKTLVDEAKQLGT